MTQILVVSICRLLDTFTSLNRLSFEARGLVPAVHVLVGAKIAGVPLLDEIQMRSPCSTNKLTELVCSFDGMSHGSKVGERPTHMNV